jgi:hypothetical protein
MRSYDPTLIDTWPVSFDMLKRLDPNYILEADEDVLETDLL